MENSHHKNIGVKSPFIKVLKVLRKLFQKFSKWVWAKPKVFPLLSGSGASGDSRLANPAGRDWAREQPEFVAREMATPKFEQRKDRIKNPIG